MGKNFIQQKCSINIHAKGDFPLLRFTDIRNSQLSVSTLWERFQLTRLNKKLLTELTQAEMEYANSDQTNQSVSDLQRNLSSFNWDFGKVPIKYASTPRKITLTVKNVGGVDAEWVYKLPNDSEIELEPWADPGEPTPEQAFEKHILDNNIFMIEPRRGFLKPGEQTDINVYYVSKEVNFHHLKVFLQILNGKPLILNFQGETLSRRAHLQLIKDEYHVPPIPIGQEWQVTYPIEIKNLGITKLKYKIDMGLLEELNSTNHNFRVFDIENPEGVLMPNETQYLYTLFRPLESKQYSLDLPIKVSDIEGVVQNLTLKLRGVGYQNEENKPEPVQFYEDLPKSRAHLGTSDASLAAFSIEEIDFGEVAPGTPTHRMVILYNTSTDQKLKFEFQKTGLLCADNIDLVPISGEIEPNSHKTIKMTLTAAQFPTFFEGEIQCSIEWEDSHDIELNNETHQTGTRSAITHILDTDYLFLRLRKQSSLKKVDYGIECREEEPLIKNIVSDALNEVLEDDETNELFEKLKEDPPGLFKMFNEEDPPTCQDVSNGLDDLDEIIQNKGYDYEPFENELKTFTHMEDDQLYKKRLLLDKKFRNMLEYMLEDTVFNLMEEATHEEFDLAKVPKTYIRK